MYDGVYIEVTEPGVPDGTYFDVFFFPAGAEQVEKNLIGAAVGQFADGSNLSGTGTLTPSSLSFGPSRADFIPEGTEQIEPAKVGVSVFTVIRLSGTNQGDLVFS